MKLELSAAEITVLQDALECSTTSCVCVEATKAEVEALAARLVAARVEAEMDALAARAEAEAE